MRQKPLPIHGRFKAPSPDLALAFFCGGVFVIFVLLCYEAYLWKKRR